jgi:hypothetical protein
MAPFGFGLERIVRRRGELQESQRLELQRQGNEQGKEPFGERTARAMAVGDGYEQVKRIFFKFCFRVFVI